MIEDVAIILTPSGHVKSCFSETAPSEEMRKRSSRLVLKPELVDGLDGLAAGDSIKVTLYQAVVKEFGSNADLRVSLRRLRSCVRGIRSLR